MTSRSWSPAPYGAAELAPFRDADDLLSDLLDGVAALAAREGAVLLGAPPPRVASFEARLRLTLARSPDDERGDERDDERDDQPAHDLAVIGAFATGAEATFARDAHRGPRTAPLLASAMRAWKLDLTARWCLGLCLGWELLPALNDALAAVVARPTMTVDGLASLLGGPASSGDVAAAARVSRAVSALERLALVELDANGPWFQRGVRITEAARALALATAAAELWPPHRPKRAADAPADPQLRSALLRSGHHHLRGDAPALLAALAALTAELGLPFFLGSPAPGAPRSVGAALRDALAASAPVVLQLDGPAAWELASRAPWPARTLLVEHAPGVAPYQLLALD